MILIQLRIATRSLLRDRGYSFLNYAGLTLGASACLFLMLAIEKDMSFDKHFEDSERVFRITSERILPASDAFSAASPRSLGPFLAEDFAHGSAQTRLSSERASQVSITVDNTFFYEDGFRFGDPSFFDVFDTEFIAGTAESALLIPFSLVLTESTAARYFPATSPVGKSLSARLVGDGDWFEYTITGVIRDFPERTHFKINALATYADHPLVGSTQEQDNWLGLDVFTYIKLAESEDAAAVENALNMSTASIISERLANAFDVQGEEIRSGGLGVSFRLQPITTIHLNSHLLGELHANQDINRLILMGALAAFILLLACVNFVNLSTARAVRRMKLIGVRQALGASRTALIRDMLIESSLVVSLAVGTALLILIVGKGLIGGLTGIYVSVPVGSPFLWVAVTLLVGATTFFSGMYPSLVLSKPGPVQNLLSRPSVSSRAFRTSLVMFQFVISALLIIGSLSVRQQLDYMHGKNLGYQPEDVVVLEGTESARRLLQPFKSQILQLPGIETLGSGQAVPGQTFPRTIISTSASSSTLTSNQDVEVQWLTVAEGYIESLGISLLAGRTFELGNPLDSTSVILNEEAVRALGLSDPLGSSIRADGRDFEIAGIVGDFHFESLETRIEPLVLFGPDPFSQNRPIQNTVLRLSSGDYVETIAEVRETWNQIVPGRPFRYYVLGSRISALYPSVDRMSKLGLISALFALLIAALGLIGLATASVNRRQREIGVRKVLGASTLGIIRLLTAELTKPILIALLFALPVGWILSIQWMKLFAYSPSPSVSILLLTSIVCIVVAIVSVSSQGLRAARWEPTRHLKAE